MSAKAMARIPSPQKGGPRDTVGALPTGLHPYLVDSLGVVRAASGSEQAVWPGRSGETEAA